MKAGCERIAEEHQQLFEADNVRSDLANAIRFVLTHGDDVRWVGQWGNWLVWDGRRCL